MMNLFVSFWAYLPWVAIGLMAALAWRKRQDSRSLMLQACGAGASFVLGIFQSAVGLLLRALNSGAGVMNAANIIFGFLLFCALCLFAAGYCVERFTRRKPVEVAATPAE